MDTAAERSNIREGGRNRRVATRAVLLSRMNAIVRTAQDVALDEPGADSTFQPPAGLSDVMVLAAARGYLANLDAVKGAFVERSFPPTFVDDFRQVTETFANALDGRVVNKTDRSDATAAIVAAVDRAMKAARRLDVIVANAFADDPSVIARWKRERRIGGIGAIEEPVPDDQAPSPHAPAEAAIVDHPLRRAS